jgi:hypothetical protein
MSERQSASPIHLVLLSGFDGTAAFKFHKTLHEIDVSYSMVMKKYKYHFCTKTISLVLQQDYSRRHEDKYPSRPRHIRCLGTTA